ncbi:MAG: VTT domain-containing protein, partial [Steroidobacteraceae bacterium]
MTACSEALPVFGAFVPGDAIILGISALVPTGALRLWPLIFAATAGAILGDGFSFWLGRHYREPIVSRWPISRYPGLVTRGEAFLRRHGGKSVFIARFTPGVRAIVPMLSGMLLMSPARFYSMNVLSAAGWGPAHILAGVAIGATFVVLGAVAGRLAVIVAILIVLIGLIVWVMRYTVRRLPSLAATGLERLRAWAQRRKSWLGRSLLSILDPSRKELPGLALLGAILVASLWLFLGVLQDVLAGDPLVRANEAVFHFLQSLRTEWVDRAMVAITELGDAPVVIAVAVVVLLWFAWRRNWRGAAHAAGAVGLSSLLTLFIKAELHVPRPHALYSGWGAFAFPGGHSAANAALY